MEDVVFAVGGQSRVTPPPTPLAPNDRLSVEKSLIEAESHRRVQLTEAPLNYDAEYEIEWLKRRRWRRIRN